MRPAGAPVALGSLPLRTVRAAIASSLESFERAHSFERWTIAEQRRLLNVATCRADALPEPAAIDFGAVRAVSRAAVARLYSAAASPPPLPLWRICFAA